VTIPIPYSATELANAFPEYTFVETLGEGTFKVAYRVSDAAREEFVLKVVKSPIDPTATTTMGESEEEEDGLALPERVRREIEAMRVVISDRIVRIIEGPEIRQIGPASCLWYLELYYPGGTLRRQLGSLMSSDDVRILAGDLLEGVSALADASLVHRDIKPENIVLDGANRAVLLDLGIALHMELEDVTSSDMVSPLTEKYAAPEQFKLKRETVIDHRTDLFQVGIVLFEALTGVHPFNPTGPRPAYVQRLESHSYDSGALDDVPDCEQLKGFILRLLKPAPNQRYRTIAVAMSALGAVPS
jgi:serine/threonine protein kinase